MIKTFDTAILREHCLNSVICHDDHRTTDTAGKLWNHAFVHALQALVLQHLPCAIQRRLVDAILWRFFGFQHDSSAHGIERIVEGHDGVTSHLSCNESSNHSKWALVLLVWIHCHNLRKCA